LLLLPCGKEKKKKEEKNERGKTGCSVSPATGPPLPPHRIDLLPTHRLACKRRVREREMRKGKKRGKREMAWHPDMWGLHESHTDSAIT
jgi:hypothetical protein